MPIKITLILILQKRGVRENLALNKPQQFLALSKKHSLESQLKFYFVSRGTYLSITKIFILLFLKSCLFSNMKYEKKSNLI